MPQEQPESSKTDAVRFDSWLREASESELQEFIDEALKSLSLELLRECKSRVDARLAAEPETKVFSISDPHVIRLRLWGEIKGRLEAEISYRSGESAQKTASASPERRHPDPEVAKRRAIVRANESMSAQDLCKRLDFGDVAIPDDWENEGVTCWVEAYRSPKLRHRVESLISRDKTSD